MVYFFTFTFPHVLLLLLPGLAQISFALSQLLLRSYVTAAMKIILFVKKWHFLREKTSLVCHCQTNLQVQNVLSRIFSQQHCFINTCPYCNRDWLNKYHFICFYMYFLNLLIFLCYTLYYKVDPEYCSIRSSLYITTTGTFKTQDFCSSTCMVNCKAER